MRLYAGDIRILSRNRQVISKIADKFGTVENFAEKINMSPKTVRQYLNQNKEYTDNFLAFLTEHIGDYRSLLQIMDKQVIKFSNSQKKSGSFLLAVILTRI